MIGILGIIGGSAGDNRERGGFSGRAVAGLSVGVGGGILSG